MSSQKLYLTGADRFYEALLKDSNENPSNSHSSILIAFKNRVDTFDLQERITTNKWVQKIAKIGGIEKKVSSVAYWKEDQNLRLEITSTSRESIHFNELLNEKIRSCKNLVFNIIESKKDNQFFLCFYWNHLLMDGYGGELLLQNLFSSKPIEFYTHKKNKPSFKSFIRGKKYVQLFQNQNSHHFYSENKSDQKEVYIFRFKDAELEKLKQDAQKIYPLGGLFFLFLAKISKALEKSSSISSNTKLWISVPNDQRKVGAKGPVLGNQNNFIFFNIDLSLNEVILAKNLHHQMIRFTKKEVYKDVNALLNSMRYFSLPFNKKKINAKSQNLGSFLCTQTIKNRSFENYEPPYEFNQFLNLPPCPDNPGLTFSIHEYKDEVTLVMQHKYKNTVSLDLESLKKRLSFA